jgi:hypothetical protein
LTTVPFRPGDGIAWRNCPRIDATRVERPSYAIAMTVVHDTPDQLALFRRPGHRMWRRNAELSRPAAFRHPKVARYLDGWTEEPIWSRWRVLVLKRPESHHAISLFWADGSDELHSWYIDLIGPLRRRSFGFDFPEHGLDIVVEPDLSSWRWKDEDELEWDVERGIYTRAEADELHAEGERAVELLLRERVGFERWVKWRPDPRWPTPTMPAGWDVA